MGLKHITTGSKRRKNRALEPSRWVFMIKPIGAPTLVMAIALPACALFSSWDDVMGSWVGSDISKIAELWGAPDQIRSIDSETQEYKYHLEKLDPSCVHYWYVDSKGVISGYSYEGRCRPIG